MHKPADNRLLWAVNLGHMTNDVFMSMRAVLLAFISAAIMPLANWQIGLAISAGELVGAVSQPVFGWLADKTGGRWLGAGGVVWTASGIMLAMLVVAAGGGFWLMLIPLALAALGSGAFHPVGSLYAANVNPARSARNAAFFFMFGQLGLGLGPALAGLLLENARPAQSLFVPVFQTIAWERGSLSPIFVLLLLVFPAAVLMAFTIPNKHEHVTRTPVKAAVSATERAAIPVLPFIILLLAVSLRSLANPAIVSFIPQMFQQKGWTPSEYGLLTSAFWVASGIAGVIFGYIGDRFDLRRVVMVSVIIAVPGIFLLPGLDGTPAFALAILVGAMSGSHSLIVVLAQSLLPGRMGFASGMILGLIFATGAVGNLIVGGLIDQMGAPNAFQLVAVITLLGSGLWLLLPWQRKSVVTMEMPPVTAVEAQPS